MDQRDRLLELIKKRDQLVEKKNRIGFHLSALNHKIDAIRCELENESRNNAKVTVVKPKNERKKRQSYDPKRDLMLAIEKKGLAWVLANLK